MVRHVRRAASRAHATHTRGVEDTRTHTPDTRTHETRGHKDTRTRETHEMTSYKGKLAPVLEELYRLSNDGAPDAGLHRPPGNKNYGKRDAVA